MSAYNVDYQIDLMDAYDKLSVLDRKDFIYELIGKLDDADQCEVAQETVSLLTEDSQKSVVNAILDNTTPAAMMCFVEDIANYQLTEEQRQELIVNMKENRL